MRIHFYIRFHTEPGQVLSVMGNCVALGNNDPEQSLQLNYLNHDYWHGTIEIIETEVEWLRYKYFFTNQDGYRVFEGSNDRQIKLSRIAKDELELIDTWNHAGEYENVFYTDPFQHVLLKSHSLKIKAKLPRNYTHIFKVKAPLLKKNEALCILGNGKALENWNTNSPPLMTKENGWWSIKFNLQNEIFPLFYKYGIYNVKDEKFIRYEGGDNRFLQGHADSKKVSILHDGFAQLPNNAWKGSGVSIPVFSLRSKKSFGIGEFIDLKLLVDWAGKTGLKVIQILPVNDTTATHGWRDSYPYAAISVFALNPIYLNLEKLAGKEYADILEPLKKKQKQLNGLADLNYEEVLQLKLAAIKELFVVQKDTFLNDKDFLEFFEQDKHWLVPYAAFCNLRDRNGTSDFTQWKAHKKYNRETIEKYVLPTARHYDQIALHYFMQYHLHLQLKEAADYAHESGIILKGDIPIGVYRYSCDTWMEPELFHMDMQAGAPPDDFAVRGQNWGFPTYVWEKMEEDHFEWWHKRFIQMSNYFGAFRVDHILGFFRIWGIPVHSIEGIMGHFVPAIPVHINEFGQRGIWFDHYRYCNPFINDSVLWELFGPNSDKFKPFLLPIGNGYYSLKDEFSTQRQVENHFKQLEPSDENQHIQQGLFDLISNVILFEHQGSNGQQFHFRFNMHETPSFRHFDQQTQYQLKELYLDYYFRRQDNFWMKEAMKKLPALKNSTNMLICGEDLGLVPHCVPEVMKQLGILSLEIQRMPKDTKREFFHPADAPYLSVVTPSTHDMSTIRGWWEEDRAKTQRFYNQELGQWGDAPYYCEPWINKAIVVQHLYSPAIWSIFQLQDLLGISEKLRRENPHEERINIPADPNHYWKYRIHLTLEQLVKEKEFNHELKAAVQESGR